MRIIFCEDIYSADVTGDCSSLWHTFWKCKHSLSVAPFCKVSHSCRRQLFQPQYMWWNTCANQPCQCFTIANEAQIARPEIKVCVLAGFSILIGGLLGLNCCFSTVRGVRLQITNIAQDLFPSHLIFSHRVLWAVAGAFSTMLDALQYLPQRPAHQLPITPTHLFIFYTNMVTLVQE